MCTSDLKRCAVCDLPLQVYYRRKPMKWDAYFHTVCISVSSKSACLSRQIGAILVKEKSIVATGYNGPARGIPHCGHERFMKDDVIKDLLTPPNIQYNRNQVADTCPRKLLGYESGTHLEICPAQHAEANAISNAARLGVSVNGATLYMNCVIPCKDCFGALINAGIIEIVVDDAQCYDVHTQFQIDNSSITIRSFDL